MKDWTEKGLEARKKLEQEGIGAFACDSCKRQFSQQDKKEENYLISYGHGYVDYVDKGCQEETYLIGIKHKSCPS